MDTVAVVLFLILVLGWAAFLFGILYIIGRIIAGIGRGVVSIFSPRMHGASDRRVHPSRAVQVCPRPQCRRIEYRNAMYCSQCGARLTGTPPGRHA